MYFNYIFKTINIIIFIIQKQFYFIISEHSSVSQEVDEINIVSENPNPFDDIVGIIEDLIIGLSKLDTRCIMLNK